MLACIFTHTKIKEEDLPEGDEIKMCEAMDRLFNQFEEKGRKEERINTLQSTVRSLLNVKFGNISNRLDQQITNTSIEKLNQLTLNIFNVTSEEDVLRIIN